MSYQMVSLRTVPGPSYSLCLFLLFPQRFLMNVLGHTEKFDKLDGKHSATYDPLLWFCLWVFLLCLFFPSLSICFFPTFAHLNFNVLERDGKRAYTSLSSFHFSFILKN